MTRSRLNLPNIITIARIAVCPLIFYWTLSPTLWERFAAFGLFLVAAVSDLWDGYLARKHGWITDLGKLLDPLADKLLLVSTLIPFYLVSRRPEVLAEVPWWGPLPLWVVLVFLIREFGVTVFRSWAAGRGVVISAGPAGKYKAFLQNLFAGGLLLWYPLVHLATSEGWSGPLWEGWAVFHRAWVGLLLAVALFLTLYSMGIYLWEYRRLIRRTT